MLQFTLSTQTPPSALSQVQLQVLQTPLAQGCVAEQAGRCTHWPEGISQTSGAQSASRWQRVVPPSRDRVRVHRWSDF